MKYPNDYIVDIFECDEQLSARFLLGNSGNRTLLCFGINPSCANQIVSDQTMNKVIEFAFDNNFDSCIMMNPYPLRGAKPSELPEVANENLLEKNFNYIEEIFKKYSGSVSYAMWGDFINERKYFKQSVIKILELSKKHNIQWKYIYKLSCQGNPYHFSYLSRICKKEERYKYYISCDFNIDEYILKHS